MKRDDKHKFPNEVSEPQVNVERGNDNLVCHIESESIFESR
jgi:hypothetical protein